MGEATGKFGLDDSLGNVYEHGVLFQCTPHTESKKSPQAISYWVVGLVTVIFILLSLFESTVQKKIIFQLDSKRYTARRVASTCFAVLSFGDGIPQFCPAWGVGGGYPSSVTLEGGGGNPVLAGKRRVPPFLSWLGRGVYPSPVLTGEYPRTGVLHLTWAWNTPCLGLGYTPCLGLGYPPERIWDQWKYYGMDIKYPRCGQTDTHL